MEKIIAEGLCKTWFYLLKVSHVLLKLIEIQVLLTDVIYVGLLKVIHGLSIYAGLL